MNRNIFARCFPIRNLFSAIVATMLLVFTVAASQSRERISLNEGWRFALGHASDPSKDFNHATGYFSYLAKTGFGDGPASAAFDDRGWRRVRLPHDWAVEMPFDPKGSHSHGYKAVGPGFPENSVGWYRRSFEIAESDLGRRIWVVFDGIYRDANVFINGFFVGNEPSGYLNQAYDLTDYLNYGGENVLAVRVDASMEEGWFYEGAGIYRHAWLEKMNPIHFVRDGIWVHSEVAGDEATMTIRMELRNDGTTVEEGWIVNTLKDPQGKKVAESRQSFGPLSTLETVVFEESLEVAHPLLWSLETPNLYTLESRLVGLSGREIDLKVTTTGIRTIRFDPKKGFFLNGKHVKIKGTNNHQDHAGVGAAIPDPLQEWRLQQLKAMGSNTYRASHNPPTPELLEACDRLGILVINEARLMGINPYHLTQLERLMRRDRNHPSVILWCIGNEEWAIEGNIKGERITMSMQAFAKKLDPFRPMSVAISGGWGGISRVVEAMGVNYIRHGDTDRQHEEFPWQILLGTEETTTQQTRGIYFEDAERCHLPPLEDGSSGGNAESGWQHYAARDYLAGVCYWTGFDYRGEPTPYAYPAIGSQFGILDTCGFPKDGFFYLRSWWTEEPVLHLFPHWNWQGREGEVMDVRVHSNCEKVTLYLNGKALGEQSMPVNGHLAWQVPYEPGVLEARGVRADGATMRTQVRTTGAAHQIQLATDHPCLAAGKRDLAVITVSVHDQQGDIHPTAGNLIAFALEGPGTIIGVGNGDPSSLEADVYVETVWSETLGSWSAPDPSDPNTPVVFEATFARPKVADGIAISLLLNVLGLDQKVSINGKPIDGTDLRSEVAIDLSALLEEGNVIRMEAKPFPVWRDREGLFQFHPATLRFEKQAPAWQRSVFNGLAQVLVESEGDVGMLTLTASSDGLQPAVLEIPVGKVR